jgi:hypothetical protein
MASSDDLISFQAFVATSSKAATVSDASVDCVLFDFMICVCDFYLIGVRRTDKLFIFSLVIIPFVPICNGWGMVATLKMLEVKINQM